jgi:hypothetical protein
VLHLWVLQLRLAADMIIPIRLDPANQSVDTGTASSLQPAALGIRYTMKLTKSQCSFPRRC